MQSLIDIDKSIFFFFNGMHNPFWDVVMALFTRTEYWILFYAILIFYIIKRYRLKAVLILVVIALTILVADQFSGLIKDSVQRLRPTHDPSMQELVHNVLSRGGKYSYFSAHASNTFAVATLLSLVFKNRNFNILIFCWATVVSYTRLYLGVHFPFDIVTGIAFGLLLGWAMYKLILFSDKRLFMLGLPMVSDAKLRPKDLRFILIYFFVLLLSTFIVVNRLLHFNWIQL
ncbi:phosphatase PAP2 family protein [Mangrovibacterium marinum]|uniref:Undecaprenyl-diphosphatase n=1 Tax=Mangrovibacterium marinum TaxID=1639118 RepID=A0A2T5BYF1_9BACT|nr:phosphatase PAP2 family protein [Mangrovibacterium marinum]PTN07220.1 undecaprenyl-diphosphatase [Mangrovibacterium marinum]